MTILNFWVAFSFFTSTYQIHKHTYKYYCEKIKRVLSSLLSPTLCGFSFVDSKIYYMCDVCVCVLAEYVWKMHDFHALLLNVRVCKRFLCEWTGCACVTLIGSILLCRVSNTKTCISFSFTIRSPNVKLYSFVCMYTVTNLIWN